ncbi:hypothetical protein GCM10011428_46220 [Streptomyces violaceus]|nr:hypothetical protein GCM10010270_41620 [Streptomyces janthinus]
MEKLVAAVRRGDADEVRALLESLMDVWRYQRRREAADGG